MAYSTLLLLLAVFCLGALAQGELKEKPESEESVSKTLEERKESEEGDWKPPGGEKNDSYSSDFGWEGDGGKDTTWDQTFGERYNREYSNYMGGYNDGRDSYNYGRELYNTARDLYDYGRDIYIDARERYTYTSYTGDGYSGGYDRKYTRGLSSSPVFTSPYFYFYVVLVKTPHWGITTRVLGARLSAADACPAGVPYVPYACPDASACESAMCGDLDPNSPDSNITCVPTYCGGCHHVAFFNKTDGRPVKCKGEQTGKCPAVPYGKVGTCAVECETDDDCKAVGSKCCSNGCGMTCQRAEMEVPKNLTQCRLYLAEEEDEEEAGDVLLWIFRPDNRGGKLFSTDPLGNGTYFRRFHGDRNKLGAEVKEHYPESSDVVAIQNVEWRGNLSSEGLQAGFRRVAVCDCDDCHRKPTRQFGDGFVDEDSFMPDFGKDRGSFNDDFGNKYGGNFGGGSIGGNFGEDRGSIGGNFGGDRGSIGGNFGGDRGSISGNFGRDRGSIGGNFGGDRGYIGGNFGGDRVSIGGNFGGDRGSIGGNFGGDRGSIGGNFGGDRGSVSGNFGGDRGSIGGNFGGDRGSITGNFEGDRGSVSGNFGGDRGSIGGNLEGGNFGGDQGGSFGGDFGGDGGSFGGDFGGDRGSFGGDFGGDRGSFGGDPGSMFDDREPDEKIPKI
ncbi:PREDICTED: uncharacterized protein LOC109467315 [Branchiostoma belcheri]|uniref:Uncharacterized protein LOC109467315 n=1 Tax=Branchiostoma belcheri TaxID=7741 RepID=A0A6P4YQ75_BRABE|nr:PREDICTED: uncharacterized protein LOC109467315 [Branchiostoma belcheri]